MEKTLQIKRYLVMYVNRNSNIVPTYNNIFKLNMVKMNGTKLRKKAETAQIGESKY